MLHNRRSFHALLFVASFLWHGTHSANVPAFICVQSSFHGIRYIGRSERSNWTGYFVASFYFGSARFEVDRNIKTARMGVYFNISKLHSWVNFQRTFKQSTLDSPDTCGFTTDIYCLASQ